MKAKPLRYLPIFLLICNNNLHYSHRGHYIMKQIDSFIEYLAGLETPNPMSLNLYYGNSKEAEMRRENLRYYLNEMKKINPKCILIGEAPGRWGCFLTGVPFTDEYTIANNPFFEGLNKMQCDKKPQVEATASVVWGCLNKINVEDYPLMWNIYPFHPSNVDSTHLLSKERGNRHPNGKECVLGKEVLLELLDIFNIERFYAIGCKSRDMLKSKYTNIEYIRHPSFGGANIFKEQFGKIYHI